VHEAAMADDSGRSV